MKNGYRKKLLGCLLGAALLCSLAACGQPRQTAASGQSQAPSQGQVSSQSQAPQSTGATAGSESSRSQAAQATENSTEAAKPEATPPTEPKQESEGHVMVVYFSATGNTKAVAEVIAAATDGELYELVPEVPYTADDLNWNEPTSRSNKEHEDPAIRPAIAGNQKDLSGYDTIFIGYPLWWGEAPNIVWNFVESSDWKGKTVIPFATSASSGIGSSGKTLEGFAPDASWQAGQRFQSGAPEADVKSWVSGLNMQ